MSKYKERGPYHFVEYADCNSIYHAHVCDLVEQVHKVIEKEDYLKRESEPSLFPSDPFINKVHEVGCGEGLILFKLWQFAGRRIEWSGHDIDKLAIAYGKALLPSWFSLFHETLDRMKNIYDAVIFADSLEHIEDWQAHLEWAKQSKIVVIAVPDRRDRHACNDFTKRDSLNHMFIGWDLAHSSTREHRHLQIWVKK